MTKQEAIKFIQDNPYKKIKHRLFAPDEYLYGIGDAAILDENGYVFEDWYSHCDGMRIRKEDFWQEGWYVYNE